MGTGPEAYLQGSIRMTLEDLELWKTFHEIGTEMIITKPGRSDGAFHTNIFRKMSLFFICVSVCVFRRMFPHCKVNLSGLIQCANYILLVDMVPEDGFRYKVKTINYNCVVLTCKDPSVVSRYPLFITLPLP